MTLFADVVEASGEVAGTGSRSRKIAILAELLRALGPEEIGIAVGFLSGVPRQGRFGVGYSIAYGVERTPAAAPSLTIAEVDRAISAIQELVGDGSASARREILGELFGRATAAESDFLRRLFTGELRQGALAGLMVDAIAKAATVPGELVRRARMLSGDLPGTARTAMTVGEAGLREVGFEIFRPVMPMLASTATDVEDAMAGFGRASVEWKLDGIRIQIHRRDDEVRIYTRNLNDITPALGGIAEVVRRLPASRAVLDGEALWMGDGGPAAFQETVSMIDAGAPPEGVTTFLFDLLHVDGENLPHLVPSAMTSPVRTRPGPSHRDDDVPAGQLHRDPGGTHRLEGNFLIPIEWRRIILQGNFRRRRRGYPCRVHVVDRQCTPATTARPSSGAIFDLAITVVALAGSLGLLSRGGIDSSLHGSRELDLAGVVLAACSTVPLIAWRHHPLGVFAFTAAAGVLLAGYPLDLMLGPIAALPAWSQPRPGDALEAAHHSHRGRAAPGIPRRDRRRAGHLSGNRTPP